MNTDLLLFEAALFNREPKIGSTDCSGEIHYTGYRRIPFVSDGKTNFTDIVFPRSQQNEPVLATHIAVITSSGFIVGSEPL